MGTDSEKHDLVTESTNLLQNGYKRRRKHASTCRKAVVMVSCVMQQLTTYGVGYGLSVMYAELIIVFNALRTDAALIQSLNMGLATAAGIFFVGLVKKLGPGKCIMLGGVLASVGLFISAFADGLFLIIICTGLLSGLALSINSLSSYIVTSLMFPDSASLYLIILTTGVSLGQFIYPLLVDAFISQYTWSGAFMLTAAVTLHSVPFGLVIYFSKDYFVSENSPQDKKTSSVCDRTLLTDSVQWILFVNAFILFGTINTEAWFIVDHMVSLGFTRESGSIIVSVIGIGSFTGRFVGGLLRYVFRFPTSYHWMYLLLVVAGLHALVINLADFWTLLFTCFIYGIMFATSGSQLGAITFEMSGIDRYPQAIALVSAFAGLGDTLFPLFGGFIKDTFGVYDVAFYTAAGGSIYMSVTTMCMVYIERRRKLVDRTYG